MEIIYQDDEIILFKKRIDTFVDNSQYNGVKEMEKFRVDNKEKIEDNNNYERYKDYYKKYGEDNKKTISTYKKDYYKKNRERILERSKKYYQNKKKPKINDKPQ